MTRETCEAGLLRRKRKPRPIIKPRPIVKPDDREGPTTLKEGNILKCDGGNIMENFKNILKILAACNFEFHLKFPIMAIVCGLKNILMAILK